jgi:AraC-like DNA-binding protein
MRKSTGSGDPMLIARHYADLKGRGTLETVASQLNVSASHVSRYLSLLKLPEAAQKEVSAGTLPVRDAAKIWRSRQSSSHTSVLPDGVLSGYRLVGDKVVLTAAQFAAFSDKRIDAARRLLAELVARGLVEAHKEIRPHVYRLSSGGAARLGKSFQRRWISASAMHQYLMRNEVELKYRKEGDYRYFDRVELFKLGFHPSVAEHILETTRDGVNRRSLILIDDYIMPLHRIGQRLARLHSPAKKYYTGDQRQWLQLIDQVVIFTTEKERVSVHKKALKDEIDKFSSLSRTSAWESPEIRDTKRAMLRSADDVKRILATATVAHVPAVLDVR